MNTESSESTPLQRDRSQRRGAQEFTVRHGFIYRVMFGSYGLLFKIGGLKVHGQENVPREGPVIIAPNHASLFDPPLVGCTTPRPVTTMGKIELFEKKTCGLKILGWIIQRMGTFPVRRGRPDRRALRMAMHVLKNGEALVIFPEGTRTRSGELGPPEHGLALIAHSTKAPVVPMYLKGTDAGFSPMQPKFRIIHPEVFFGPPLRFEEEYAHKGDRPTLDAIGSRIMEEIAALRDAANRK